VAHLKGLKDHRLREVSTHSRWLHGVDLPKLQVLCTGVFPSNKILRRRRASLYRGKIRGPKVVINAVIDSAGWSCGMDCSAAKAPVASESARFLLREPVKEALLAVGDVVPELFPAVLCSSQNSSSGFLFPRSLTVALANLLRSSACSQLFPSLP